MARIPADRIAGDGPALLVEAVPRFEFGRLTRFHRPAVAFEQFRILVACALQRHDAAAMVAGLDGVGHALERADGAASV
jgi:hypothetical protein